MRVIPAIDVKDGKCVRLFKGDFEQVTEYSDRPVEVARRFAALDVRDLHIVDLDGARDGTGVNRDSVAAIAAETSLAVQVGGGIRDTNTLADWFDRGIDRCVIGSLAVEQSDLVREWFAAYGADRIVLALDVVIGEDEVPKIATRGWTQTTETTLWDCIETYLDAGLRHVLCTDIGRDGALSGPNVELYSIVLERYPMLELQASGGVRDATDLERLRKAGLPAAITGRALLDGRITDREVASFRQSA
jgi:phosphoribosylformimino-5-aminoimidazole carboxamide ribotide isomerase